MKIREDIKEIRGYFIDEKPVKVKLDANESPFDLPGEVKDAMLEELRQLPLNRYPDPSLKLLRKLVAEKDGVHPDTIIFGNGSDELIYMLLMCLEEGAGVAYPEPGFSMYAIGARILGRKLMPYRLAEPDYAVDATSFAGVVRQKPAIVFLGNPNNPTGNSFPRELLMEAIQDEDIIFVSDEAYFDYCGKTFMADIRNHRNLVVMRSFSKIGFAGLRLGYMSGQRELMAEFGKARLPYNINSLTQKSAEFFFRRNDLVQEAIKKVTDERARLYASLKSLGLTVLEPEANFVTFKTGKPGFYDCLFESGILVKDLAPSFGMKSFYRVTVGTEAENDYFIRTVRDFLDQ